MEADLPSLFDDWTDPISLDPITLDPMPRNAVPSGVPPSGMAVHGTISLDRPNNPPPPMLLHRSAMDIDAVALARRLIGTWLIVDGVGGIIVETEGYRRDDPASHSFRGPTPRNAAMFGPAGHAYVYRSHGLHWCFNIVAAEGGAVLIRALEPRLGLDDMAERRGLGDMPRPPGRPVPRLPLCAGPGRLARALGIDRSHDGKPLDRAPFELRDRLDEPPLLCGPRIGISQAVSNPWRFGLDGSPFLSRPFHKASRQTFFRSAGT
jgi:DNA-3-methyladenine glycosylase